MAGNTLSLGAGSQKPGWQPDPNHGLGPFGSAGFLLLKIAVCNTLPYTGGANNLRALSVAWYMKLTATAPATESWIFRMAGGTPPSACAFVCLLTSSGTVKVYNQWTGGDDITESTTALGSGDDAHFVMTRAPSNTEGSTKSRLYINGVLEDEVSCAGSRVAFNAQPFFHWGAGNAGFDSGTGAPVIIGRTLVYDGELSAAQITDMYARARLAYPNLPPA